MQAQSLLSAPWSYPPLCSSSRGGGGGVFIVAQWEIAFVLARNEPLIEEVMWLEGCQLLPFTLPLPLSLSYSLSVPSFGIYSYP